MGRACRNTLRLRMSSSADYSGLDFSKLEEDSRYDWSRKVLADPRDPRWEGAPCNGLHTPARSYKGSVSGSNQHGLWKGCETCKLRLLYVPGWGKHGLRRSAGPLPPDTQGVVDRQEKEGSLGTAAAAEELKTTSVGLEAAEKSALEQLERIRRQKGGKGTSKGKTPFVPPTAKQAPKAKSQGTARQEARDIPPRWATEVPPGWPTEEEGQQQATTTSTRSSSSTTRRIRRVRPPSAVRARVAEQETYHIGEESETDAVMTDATRRITNLWKKLLLRLQAHMEERQEGEAWQMP